MMIFEIGRLCVKIAGRDSGKYCVIIDNLGDNFVLIDGQTRRRKCNIKHLEPLSKILDIKKNASHDDIALDFKNLKLTVDKESVKEKKQQKTEKPKKAKKVKKIVKAVETKEEKPKKKVAKKKEQ